MYPGITSSSNSMNSIELLPCWEISFTSGETLKRPFEQCPTQYVRREFQLSPTCGSALPSRLPRHDVKCGYGREFARHTLAPSSSGSTTNHHPLAHQLHQPRGASGPSLIPRGKSQNLAASQQRYSRLPICQLRNCSVCSATRVR